MADNDFDNLFDDNDAGSQKNNDDLFAFDDNENLFKKEELSNSKVIEEEIVELESNVIEKEPEIAETIKPQKKRSSQDFICDMDALLLTAQSPMIIEGMKYLTMKKFSADKKSTFAEAVKGIELFITILKRNPNNYYKLSELISEDIDCREVERSAMSLYFSKFSTSPETDIQKLNAFELFRDRLRNGYYKCLINDSRKRIKIYFLYSGGLNKEKIIALINENNSQFHNEIGHLVTIADIAFKLTKTGNSELTQGMKGRDMNSYIVRSCELLSFYHFQTGHKKNENYYKRLHENYSRYFVIRE